MKRLTMPRSWPLTRKTDIWVQKPNPGGHSDEMCMPLGVILRDVLDLAHNLREAKRMLATRQVLVDGRIETDLGRGVGLMDVLTVGEDSFRCILDVNGKLRYRSISDKAAASGLPVAGDPRAYPPPWRYRKTVSLRAPGACTHSAGTPPASAAFTETPSGRGNDPTQPSIWVRSSWID